MTLAQRAGYDVISREIKILDKPLKQNNEIVDLKNVEMAYE